MDSAREVSGGAPSEYRPRLPRPYTPAGTKNKLPPLVASTAPYLGATGKYVPPSTQRVPIGKTQDKHTPVPILYARHAVKFLGEEAQKKLASSSKQYTALKEEWDMERQKFTAVRTELEAKLQHAQAKREQVEALAEEVESWVEGGTSAGDEPLGERKEMMRRNLASLETELTALNRDVNILQRQWRTTFGLMQAAQKACKLVMEEAALNLSEKAHLCRVLQGKEIALDLDEWLKTQAHTLWSWGLAALQHPITDLCAHTSRHLGMGTSSYVIVEAPEQLAPSRAPSPTRAAGSSASQPSSSRAASSAVNGEAAEAVEEPKRERTDEALVSSGEESLALVTTTGAEQEERASGGKEGPPQAEEELSHAEFPFGDPNQQLQYFSCCRASEYLLGSIIPHAQGLVRGVWQTGSAVLVRDVAANPRVYLAPARKSTKAQRVSAERSLLDAAAAGAPTASPAEEEAEEQAEGAEGEAADGAKAEAEAEAEAELEAEAEEAVAERKKIAQEFKDSAGHAKPRRPVSPTADQRSHARDTAKQVLARALPELRPATETRDGDFFAIPIMVDGQVMAVFCVDTLRRPDVCKQLTESEIYAAQQAAAAAAALFTLSADAGGFVPRVGRALQVGDGGSGVGGGGAGAEQRELKGWAGAMLEQVRTVRRCEAIVAMTQRATTVRALERIMRTATGRARLVLIYVTLCVFALCDLGAKEVVERKEIRKSNAKGGKAGRLSSHTGPVGIVEWAKDLLSSMAGYEELMGADTWEMVRANVQLRERQAGGGGTSLQRSMRTAPLHDKKSSNFSLRRTRAFVEATLSKVSHAEATAVGYGVALLWEWCHAQLERWGALHRLAAVTSKTAIRPLAERPDTPHGPLARPDWHEEHTRPLSRHSRAVLARLQRAGEPSTTTPDATPTRALPAALFAFRGARRRRTRRRPLKPVAVPPPPELYARAAAAAAAGGYASAASSMKEEETVAVWNPHDPASPTILPLGGAQPLATTKPSPRPSPPTPSLKHAAAAADARPPGRSAVHQAEAPPVKTLETTPRNVSPELAAVEQQAPNPTTGGVETTPRREGLPQIAAMERPAAVAAATMRGGVASRPPLVPSQQRSPQQHSLRRHSPPVRVPIPADIDRSTAVAACWALLTSPPKSSPLGRRLDMSPSMSSSGNHMSPDRTSETQWEQHGARSEASVATAAREGEEEEEERIAVPASELEAKEQERAAVPATAHSEGEDEGAAAEAAAAAAAAAEAVATVHEESAAFAAAVTATVAVDRPSSAAAPRPPRRRSDGPRSPSDPTPNASAELAPPRALVSASALPAGDTFDSMWESGELDFLLQSPRLSAVGMIKAAPADATVSYSNAAPVDSHTARTGSSEAPILPADAVIAAAPTKNDITAALPAIVPAVSPSQPAVVTSAGAAMFGFTALSSMDWEIE